MFISITALGIYSLHLCLRKCSSPQAAVIRRIELPKFRYVAISSGVRILFQPTSIAKLPARAGSNNVERLA